MAEQSPEPVPDCSLNDLVESLLIALRQDGGIPRHDSTVRSVGGQTVVVILYPTPSSAAASLLRSLDRRCLAVLAQSDAPLSIASVRRTLINRGLGRPSLSTVKRSLQRLRQAGLVGCRRTGHRGHFLLIRDPLFERRQIG
jgi:hypothetical protein